MRLTEHIGENRARRKESVRIAIIRRSQGEIAYNHVNRTLAHGDEHRIGGRAERCGCSCRINQDQDDAARSVYLIVE